MKLQRSLILVLTLTLGTSCSSIPGGPRMVESKAEAAPQPPISAEVDSLEALKRKANAFPSGRLIVSSRLLRELMRSEQEREDRCADIDAQLRAIKDIDTQSAQTARKAP